MQGWGSVAAVAPTIGMELDASAVILPALQSSLPSLAEHGLLLKCGGIKMEFRLGWIFNSTIGKIK